MEADRPWKDVIRDRIGVATHQWFPENEDRSFITSEALHGVWQNSTIQFQALQKAMGMTFDAFPFNDVIQVISILIMTSFRDWQLVGSLITSGLRDKSLPFQHEVLKRYFSSIVGGAGLAGEFVNGQYAFCPVVIEKGLDMSFPDRRRRLPILSEEKVGQGRFGIVTKVVIAKGYLRTTGPRNKIEYSTKDKTVARKKFLTAGDGHLEQGILKRLRREGLRHDCIMTSIASVYLGDLLQGPCDYNLFFKYADADLDRFLHSDIDFYQALDIRKDIITPRALFIQLLHLIDALRYLHQEQLLMCHSDLKLDNILIFYSRDHPAGQWKITDFGIASIDHRPPDQARGIREVITSAASQNDQRHAGPFQPPEVEFEHLVPRGTRYRAKGDIWSLGCVAVYVLVYATGGSAQVAQFDEMMWKESRSFHQGFFYEPHPGKSATLFTGMTGWVDTLSLRWDPTPPIQNNEAAWVKESWTKLISPMLTVDIPARTTAQQLLDTVQGFVRDCIPSRNVWAVFNSQEVVRTESLMRPHKTASRRVVLPTPQLPKRQLSNSISSTLTRSNISSPTDEVGDVIKDERKGMKNTPAISLSRSFETIQEEHETGGPELSPPSTQSDRNPSLSTIQSKMSETSSSCTPAYYQIDKQVPEDCRAIQIAPDGQRLFMLAKTGLKVVVRDYAQPSTWKAEDDSQMEVKSSTTWHSFHLAGTFLLLRDQNNASIRLHKLNSNRQGYRSEWDGSNVANLAGASLVAISSKGHVAFRLTLTEVAVYDCNATLLFAWNLSEFKQPHNECGNIETMAFDPEGKFLVATAWNCWYRWALDSLGGKNIPQTYGRHSYTFPDTTKSVCSLLVLNGGRYFLLHDECQENISICVDTVTKKIYELDLVKTPKAQTITISMDCEWLAYIVDSKKIRTNSFLYYCKIVNGASITTETPLLGQIQMMELRKIKTYRPDHKPVLDAVVRIVSNNEEPQAIVASITRFVEIVPLRINAAGSGKKKMKK